VVSSAKKFIRGKKVLEGLLGARFSGVLWVEMEVEVEGRDVWGLAALGASVC